jgi:Fic family protein
VEMCMAMLTKRYEQLMSNYAKSLASSTPAIAFALLIDVLCDILEAFFTVHPFANGNGHAGRMLVWVTLARQGFPPKAWSIDAKQPYAKALNEYRAGNLVPLRQFLTKLAR